MDLFVKHMDDIRGIARKLRAKFNFRFEEDELINAAYLAYDVAITNNPDYVETKFSKPSTFFFRVKNDMKDYIREETKQRLIKRMEDKNVTVPTFTNVSYCPTEDKCDGRPSTFFEPASDYNHMSLDDYELLNYMLRNTELSDRDHMILQYYYIDNLTLL